MTWSDIGVSVLATTIITLGRLEVEWYINRHKKNREYLLQLGSYMELQRIAGIVQEIHKLMEPGG